MYLFTTHYSLNNGYFAKRLITLALGVTSSACLLHAPAATAVDVWLTRGDQLNLLEQRPDATFQAGDGTRSVKINLQPSTTYQTMDGFGAAMTDSSAWLLQNKLNATQRDTLMQRLFTTEGDGIGLSYLRVPMGASDFALSPYTYNDLPNGQTDPTNAQFSVAHDEAYIIPTLQQARALNPQLQMMASPWSPPAWMKTSGQLNGGQLKPEFYDAYADYFVKFVQAYEATGLPIDRITVQNEPFNDVAGLPSAGMSTNQQSTFIGDHLGPAFAAAGIDTGILAFDHNWEDWSYPVVVANDPEASEFVVGAAFHGYAGTVDQQSNFTNFHPDLEVHYTEITGGDFATNNADNLVYSIRNSIIGATRNHAQTSLYWNIALDENRGPFLPGGCETCRGMVTIDSVTGDVTEEVEYYAYGHASKFVDPGAVRIGSDTIDGVIETVAFRNPDGSEVLIALNPNNSLTWFDVVREDESFSYRLTGQSVATFVWETDLMLTLDGDYNGDGFVSQADLDLVLLNWGDSVVPVEWIATDQFDGVQVSQNELDGVLLNWGNGAPPSVSIPEPTAVLAFAALLGVICTRSPRHRTVTRASTSGVLPHVSTNA